jgi:hypothetical protein
MSRNVRQAEKLGLGPRGGPRRPSIPLRGWRVLLFESAGAPSGAHAQIPFEVEDVEAAVEELRGRGVVFEEYDFPGLTTVHGIAEVEGNYPSKGGKASGQPGSRDSEGNMLGIGEPIR